MRALRIKGNSNMCCFVSVNADDHFTFIIHEALIAKKASEPDLKVVEQYQEIMVHRF